MTAKTQAPDLLFIFLIIKKPHIFPTLLGWGIYFLIKKNIIITSGVCVQKCFKDFDTDIVNYKYTDPWNNRRDH